jgi:flagellar basal-body rod modification protein FlgD
MSTVAPVKASSNTQTTDLSNIMKINGKLMGKDDFLKLLITQIRYQDPMDPPKNDEFVAQLAQFSSLEGIQNLNENFEKSMKSNMLLAQSLSNSAATTLIGRKVKVATSSFVLKEDAPMPIHFRVPDTMTKVTINIYDKDRTLVATKELGGMSKGDHQFVWNGEDGDGNRLPPGTYSVEVKTVDSGEKDGAARTFLEGTVDSVRFSENGAYLVINGESYGVGNVQEVLNSGENNGG